MVINDVNINEKSLPKVKFNKRARDMKYHDEFYAYISDYHNTMNINYFKKAISIYKLLVDNKPNSVFVYYTYKTLNTIVKNMDSYQKTLLAS